MSKASPIDQQKIINQLSFWLESSAIKDDSLLEKELTDPIIEGNPLQTNTVKIIDLDYNPDGSDIDNESIELLLMSGDQINLDNYILQYIKD